ncbi:MAG: hypothetical protein F6K09_04330 [Merismopedia sp. SIO2A8]|nr:hypothetical protein [Symploca sp. SIO2B6]NET47952.1 hypothetical protein [Merismopedia sp. SIO2A8]
MSRLFHSIRRPSHQSSWVQPQQIRRLSMLQSHFLGTKRRRQLRGWWHEKRQWLKDVLQHPLILGGTIWVALFLWNGAMAVAIASGTMVAVAVYLVQLNRLHVNWKLPFPTQPLSQTQSSPQARYWNVYQDIRSASLHLFHFLRQDCWPKLWTSANRPLSLSILTGGGTTILIGSVALVYHDTQSASLALVMGGQYLLIAGLGGCGWWQQRQQSDSSSNSIASDRLNSNTGPHSQQRPDSLDSLWADLASDHAPIRLIAIYRAVSWVQSRPSSSQPLPKQHFEHQETTLNVNHLMACFRLMLIHERQPTVQHALREALMTLQES